MMFLSTAQASIIQRTITIDGTFTDWTSPTNITTNPGQFSTDQEKSASSQVPPTQQSDCLDRDSVYKSDACGQQSTGRDLQYFSYTFDETRLYVYVQRFASATAATDWYFYLDADGDGLMESTERVLGVSWSGSNGATSISLRSYNPAAVGGDPLDSGGAGDGYDMPGALGATQSYNLGTSLTGGATTGALAGRQMEAQILWSDVCASCSGPQNIGFHISSSRNTNLPSSVEDNMTGTPGGIITYDLGVTKTSSANAVAVGGQFTYTVAVTNNSASAANSVTLTDALPAQVTYNSFSGTGSYNSGTGLWTIGTLTGGSTATATFTVTANASGTPTNTATLTKSDIDDSNNSAAKQVTINAAGDLGVSKTVSDNDVNSGDTFSYTVNVTNNGAAAVNGISLVDLMPPDVSFTSFSGPGSYNSGTGLWTIGTIASAATATATFNVTAGPVPAVVTRTNTATLSYSDSNNANNVAAVDVTINPPLPMLSITKVSNTSSANPQEVVTYTITVQNMGAAAAVNVLLNDDMSPYSAIDIDADNNAGNGLDPFTFNAGTSTLLINTKTYTQNNGADAYGYSLTSGASGASSGFDGSATDWRIQMSGSMPAGSSFTITYQVEVN